MPQAQTPHSSKFVLRPKHNVSPHQRDQKSLYVDLLPISNYQLLLVGGQGALCCRKTHNHHCNGFKRSPTTNQNLTPRLCRPHETTPNRKIISLAMKYVTCHLIRCSLLVDAWLSIVEERGPPSSLVPPPPGSGRPCTPTPTPPP